MVSIPYSDNLKNRRTASDLLQSSDLEQVSGSDIVLDIKLLGGTPNYISIKDPNTLTIVSNISIDESMGFILRNDTGVTIYYGYFSVDTVNTRLGVSSGLLLNGELSPGASSPLIDGGSRGFNMDELIFILTHEV